MDLFDYMRTSTMEKESPLASRMRPRTLDEVAGQKHIIGKDKLLYRAIKADKLGSVIFYGPPGTGKTTLAKVIANTTSARFEQINATVAGKKDMEEIVKNAKDALGMYGQKTILFVDEIHRFNKLQQDALLPYVEDGTVILIGATTENPYFEVNKALISRSMVVKLEPLSKKDIVKVIKRGNDKIEIQAKNIHRKEIPEDLMRQMRSSVIFVGALVGRYGKVTFSYPGGCDIGTRPIDLHLKAFEKLGININKNYGNITCTCDKIVGEKIDLDFPSVGATENAILVACLAVRKNNHNKCRKRARNC